MHPAPRTREELLDTYRHPYRRWIPIAWEHERVPPRVAAAALATVAALVAHLVDGPDPALMYAALLAAGGVLGWTLWVTLNAALIVRGRIRDWEADPDDELGAVRRRRPHAGEADTELVHAEYAVSVDDSGHLVTWRFRPLSAMDAKPSHAKLLPGTPRYDAVAVDSRPFDPLDAAVAAEQLAGAQEQAAALERRAGERAQRGLQEAQSAAELEAETRGTAAALRGITGQWGR